MFAAGAVPSRRDRATSEPDIRDDVLFSPEGDEIILSGEVVEANLDELDHMQQELDADDGVADRRSGGSSFRCVCASYSCAPFGRSLAGGTVLTGTRVLTGTCVLYRWAVPVCCAVSVY